MQTKIAKVKEYFMAKKSKANYGDGTIFFSNSKNKWMGQINVGLDENGKMKRKSVTGNSQQEVREKLNQIKFEIYSGTFVDSSQITFEQLMKQIIEDKLAMNEIQEQTAARHLETLKMLKDISYLPLQRINYSMLKQLLISKTEYSDSTIRKMYMMLNQCFNEAVKRKILAENPMGDLKRPKSKKKNKKIRGMTVDEQKRFVDVLNTHPIKYKEQMLISLYTGMRMGEINALTIDDINLNFNFISIDKTISKGKKGEAFINDSAKTEMGNRNIPINKTVKPIILSVIENYIPTNDNVIFHSTNDMLITTSQVNMEFKRIINKFEIQDKTLKGELSLHSLRHTYATRCIEGKMPPTVLQHLLGHTDIRITLDTYADVFENFQTENVALVDDYLRSVGLGA